MLLVDRLVDLLIREIDELLDRCRSEQDLQEVLAVALILKQRDRKARHHGGVRVEGLARGEGVRVS